MDHPVTRTLRRRAARVLPLLAAALLLAPPVDAQRRGWPDSRKPQPQVDVHPDETGPVSAPVAAGVVTVRLVPDVTRWVPGRTHLLGVAFRMTEGWHLYWPGQNDSGLPIALEPETPAGFVVGEAQWPAPVRHLLPGDLVDHVYHDAVTLLLPVQVPDDAPAGERLTLRVVADWLVCAEACVPGAATVELAMDVAGPTELPMRSDDAAFLDAARALVPTELPPGVSVTTDDAGRVVIHAPAAERLAFYPAEDGLPVADIAGSCDADGERLVLTPDDTLRGGVDDAPRLRGVLAIWLVDDDAHDGETTDASGEADEEHTRPSRVARVDIPYPPARDGADTGSARPDPAPNGGADR